MTDPMTDTELLSFVRKFRQLLSDGRRAKLLVESQHGCARINLEVICGPADHPQAQGQQPHHRHQARGHQRAAGGPARVRRRVRRAQARQAAQDQSEHPNVSPLPPPNTLLNPPPHTVEEPVPHPQPRPHQASEEPVLHHHPPHDPQPLLSPSMLAPNFQTPVKSPHRQSLTQPKKLFPTIIPPQRPQRAKMPPQHPQSTKMPPQHPQSTKMP